MPGDSPPSPTDEDVIVLLQAAARRGLEQSRPADKDLLNFDYDIQGVNELVSECSLAELNKHELDDNYPERQDYIAVLKVELEGEPDAFYVKVALHLPDMKVGRLLSFHFWGRS